MTHDSEVRAAGAPESPTPKVSRRAFVGLVGAGAAALLAGDASAAVPKSATRPAGATRAGTHGPSRPPDIRAGIAAQKKSLAESLVKLREQKLPTGSWPAFGFRPLKASRPR